MRKPSPSLSPPQMPSSVWPASIVQRVAGPPRQSGWNQAVVVSGKAKPGVAGARVTPTGEQPPGFGGSSAPRPPPSSPTAAEGGARPAPGAGTPAPPGPPATQPP